MVGLAILSGLRRGELFALRWQDIDEASRVLTVREAVYDGAFDTPKTEAGLRQIPLSEMALWFIGKWKGRRAGTITLDGLVFSTRRGQVLSPNNVLRRSIFPACEALNLPHATWLTFRRTYSSWSHDKGVPGKVVAQLMGHANVDHNVERVHASARRRAAHGRRQSRRRIVHGPAGAGNGGVQIS
jgi:integrase